MLGWEWVCVDLVWTAAVMVLLKYVLQLDCGTFNGIWQYANVFYSIKYGVNLYFPNNQKYRDCDTIIISMGNCEGMVGETLRLASETNRSVCGRQCIWHHQCYPTEWVLGHSSKFKQSINKMSYLLNIIQHWSLKAFRVHRDVCIVIAEIFWI